MNTVKFNKSKHFDLLSSDKKGLSDGFIHNSFEADYDLFENKPCHVSVFFPYDKDPQSSLDERLKLIQEKLDWLASNRTSIVDCIIEKDIIESAEYYVRRGEKVEDDENECYILDDGSKIRLPITNDDISNSVYFESVSVRFEDSMDKPRMDLCLEFRNPDYFAGGFFVVLISEDKEISHTRGMGKRR
jgi:hypothetical protein